MIWQTVGISEKVNSKLIDNNNRPKSIVMSISKKKQDLTEKSAGKKVLW